MHDVVAELAGDLVLQLLDAIGLELDHVAGLDVDEVVVMLAAGVFETRRPALEGVAMDRTEPLQKLHRAVDRRQRHGRVDGDGAAVNLHRVGMVFHDRQQVDDDASRPRDSHAGAAQFALVVRPFPTGWLGW